MLKDSSTSRKGGLSCSKTVPFFSVSGFDGLNATMRRPIARWLAGTAAGVVER